MGSGKLHSGRTARNRAEEGAATEFQRLYETHFPRVTRLLARRGVPLALLEDMAQEVFARAWAAQGDHPLDPAFGRILWGIARNVLREQRRKSATELARQFGREGEEGKEVGELVASDADGPLEELERRERIEQVQAALAALPPRQRQAVELVEMDHLTIEQAAERAGCTCASLRRQYRTAIQRLKKLLWQTLP